MTSKDAGIVAKRLANAAFVFAFMLGLAVIIAAIKF